MTREFIIGFVLIVFAGMQGLTIKELRELREEASRVNSLTRSERIEIYNSGFRAGSMDILSQLVECEGMKDEVTLQYYQTASDTLARMGELDTEAYPCYE